MENIIECPLTGIKVTPERTGSGETIFYHLKILNTETRVLWCHNCYKKIKSKNILGHHIIKGLILNHQIPKAIFLCENDCTMEIPHDDYEKLVFPDFLETMNYPKNASDKMDNLLLYFYDKFTYDGEEKNFNYGGEKFLYENYLKNVDELEFYIKSLKKIELIEAYFSGYNISVKLTHKGLNRIVEIENNSVKSNECFIAMAFDKSTEIYRKAIKKALINNKFKAILIDEEHLDSDKTIPDGILNNIRKAKFCIADFTLHRNGVYFESGYALGLGKQVIYTCKEDDFKNAHFDIKQLQHVLYNTPEELEKKLTDKIEFWIR